MHQKIVMAHERSKWGVNLTILQPEDVSSQIKGAEYQRDARAARLAIFLQLVPAV
jgi:hypothetical protein